MGDEFRHKDAVSGRVREDEYEHIRQHIFNSQAEGDIMRASSATQLSRLGIGNAGEVLRVVSGLPEWVDLKTVLDYGLAFYGIVTTATDTTHFKASNLAGLGTGWFKPNAGAAYEIFVVQADGAAPEGEQTPVVAYTSSDGTFQHAVLGAQLAVGDEVLIVHPLLASAGTKATAAATGAVTTTDYAMAYLKQLVTELQGVDGLVDNLITRLGTPATGAVATDVEAIITDLDNATDGLGALKILIDAIQTDVGDPTGETLASISAKIGDIARSLDVIIGARWDSSGDLGTDIAQILTYTDLIDDATVGLANIKALIDTLTTNLATVDGITDKIDDVLIPTAGVHFWVDQLNGSDANNGLTPATPVLTVTYALSLCTSGRYDVIHIMANSPSAPPATETFPIVVDKNGVTIRSEYGKGILSDSGIGSDEQNVATFQIKAHYVTIEDLYIGCDNLGTTGGIIEFYNTSSYFGCAIKRCTFDTQYVPAYGIKADYDQPYLLIEDCIFGRHDIAGYTTAAIYIGNLTAGMIRRNIFNACAGIAINAGAQAGNFDILDNKFSLPSNTAGKAITLADGSSGIFVDGNKAGYGQIVGALTVNPYVDLNEDASNVWGVNYKGSGIVDPIEIIRAATGGSGVRSLETLGQDQDAELDFARVQTLASPVTLSAAVQTIYSNTQGRPFYFAGGFISWDSGAWAGGESVTINVDVKVDGTNWENMWTITKAAAASPLTVAVPAHANSALLNIPMGFWNSQGVRVTIQQTVEGAGYHVISHEFHDGVPGS